MTSAFRLVFGSLMSKGRLVTLGVLGLVPVLLGLALRTQDSGVFNSAYHGIVEAYGLGLLVPVVSLVFASAAFGDPVDDRTLVYLWLKPVARWRLALAALGASICVALPLAVVPIAVGVSISGAGTELVRGALAGTALAVIAYCCLFLGLGLRVRRALVWGFAYVLIWEGAVARTARGAARLSINVHARSVASRIAHHALPTNGSSMRVGVAVPLVLAAVAFAITVWWLARADVA
ncbi:MAG: type transport system permease protein [Acidimicrobiaceae bacterium]|jgi:ABC-2 type transport system permease protein|nr:type transport system permease protein [Acidimicrobiaceae bacterium]